MIEVAYHRMAASPASRLLLHGCRRLSCAKRKSNHAPDATIQWRIMHMLQALYNVWCDFIRRLEIMPAAPSAALRVRAARAQQTLTSSGTARGFGRSCASEPTTRSGQTADPYGQPITGEWEWSGEFAAAAGPSPGSLGHGREKAGLRRRAFITGSRRKRQNYESEPLKERWIQPPPDRGENTANWSHSEAANCTMVWSNRQRARPRSVT